MCVCVYVCMYGWMDGWMDAWMDGWMHGCMDAWMHGCMDAWMHGCMDVCIYVCTYVCTYAGMHVCRYVRMYVCTCMYVYVRMYVCMYVRMYVCMYVRRYVCTCMYVCTYVRMYVCTCMYVCTYVCMYVCTYAGMYVCTCYVYVSMYVCTYVCMYVCTYVCMYVYVRMYVCMYVCTYAGMYVCTCYVYVRMYVCTYVRMYVCMYVRVSSCFCVCVRADPSESLSQSLHMAFQFSIICLTCLRSLLLNYLLFHLRIPILKVEKLFPAAFFIPEKNRSGLHIDVILLYYIYIYLSFIYLYAPLMKSRKFWLLCCPKAPAFGMKRPTSLCSRGNDFGEGEIENKKDMLVSKLVGMKILRPGTSLIINMNAKKLKKEHEMILIDIGHMRNPCADKDDECQGRSWNIWHCSPIDSDRNWTGFSVSLGRPEPAQSIFKPKRSTSLDRTQFTILFWSTCSWL